MASPWRSWLSTTCTKGEGGGVGRTSVYRFLWQLFKIWWLQTKGIHRAKRGFFERCVSREKAALQWSISKLALMWRSTLCTIRAYLPKPDLPIISKEIFKPHSTTNKRARKSRLLCGVQVVSMALPDSVGDLNSKMTCLNAISQSQGRWAEEMKDGP